MWEFRPYSNSKTKGITGGYFDTRASMSFATKIVIWIGARRIGKTFAAKKIVLSKCYKNEKLKFAWLRDNDEARKKLGMNSGQKFFSDMKKTKIPNIQGKITGETIFAFGRCVGYLMPSSTFQNYKGNDFDDIELIVYDEFIAEKNKKFNSNRSWEILNMLYTICSTRKNVRIFMLANALDRGDEFLQFIDVNIKDYGLYINREKDITIHYCDDHPTFKKDREQSVIGKLIKGSIFEENLFNNKFADDTKMFYDKRPAKCEIFCILCDSVGNFVRCYLKDDVFYVCKDFNNESYKYMRYTSKFENVSTNISLIPKTFEECLKRSFEDKRVFFDNANSRNIFINFFKKIKKFFKNA